MSHRRKNRTRQDNPLLLDLVGGMAGGAGVGIGYMVTRKLFGEDKKGGRSVRKNPSADELVALKIPGQATPRMVKVQDVEGKPGFFASLLGSKPKYRVKALDSGEQMVVPGGALRSLANPYKHPHYQHKEISLVPPGAVVRTVRQGDSLVRIAYWGPIKNGKHKHYRVISILKPSGKRNPIKVGDRITVQVVEIDTHTGERRAVSVPATMGTGMSGTPSLADAEKSRGFISRITGR